MTFELKCLGKKPLMMTMSNQIWML